MILPLGCRPSPLWLLGRVRHATISSQTIAQGTPPLQAETDISWLRSRIIGRNSTHRPHTSLDSLIQQYFDRSNRILDFTLPYESRPDTSRRVDFNVDGPDSSVFMVAHWAQKRSDHKVTLSSGFALETPWPNADESLILTCAHTLEEIRWSRALLQDTPTSYEHDQEETWTSGSFVVSRANGNDMNLHPVSAVVSALHRSDLLLLSKTGPHLNTLPISPYPVHPQTSIRAHFVMDAPPKEPGWRPWIGGLWSKWVKGTVLGYRDFAGTETMPGSYGALCHLLFTPPPTAGSSGGPIVDEESGAVVGVMLGTRMDNRLEGLRGWGVPSETIFEMFSLPGLEGKL